ncbi:MAG: NPCBM/NEW2 domain-containing protein [Planctomycetota bacterium]
MIRSVLIVMLAAAWALAVDVTTIDGRTLSGDTVAVRDGILEVGTDRIPLEDVVGCAWSTAAAAPSAGPVFVFRNGDRMAGTIVGGEGDRLTVRSRSFGQVLIDLRRLEFILCSGDGKLPAMAAPPAGDRVWFPNGDSLDGFVRRLAADGLVFESVAGTMHYAYGDLAGVAFQPIPAPAPVSARPHIRLTTAEGERVSGESLTVSAGGATLQSFLFSALSAAPGMVRACEVVNGRLVYLSDLTPAAVTETPFWEGGFTWTHRTDRSVDGNPLVIGGRSYARGLGVHSFCRLAYAAGGRYSRFIADIGIDDEVLQYGSVDFIVKGDGRELFRRAGVDTAMDPVPVSVDVTGVGTLELIVDFGPAYDIGDHADWAGARLVRAPAAGETRP